MTIYGGRSHLELLFKSRNFTEMLGTCFSSGFFFYQKNRRFEDLEFT